MSPEITEHYIKIGNAWNNIQSELSEKSTMDLNYF